MRTSLDSEDDVLQAAKELARRQGTSAGQFDQRIPVEGVPGACATDCCVIAAD